MTAVIAKDKHGASIYEDEEDCLVICGSDTEDEEICDTPSMGIENRLEDEDDSRDEVYSLQDFRIDATKLSLFNVSDMAGSDSRDVLSPSPQFEDDDHASQLVIYDEDTRSIHDLTEANHQSLSSDGVITIEDSDSEETLTLPSNNDEELHEFEIEHRGSRATQRASVICGLQMNALSAKGESAVVVIDSSDDEANQLAESSKTVTSLRKKKSKVTTKKNKAYRSRPGRTEGASSKGVEADYDSSDNDLEFEHKRCRPRLFSCIYCSYQTIVEEWYHEHLATSHVPEYRHRRTYCPDCSYSAGHWKFVRFHMAKVHDIHEPKFYRIGEKRYACLSCRKSTELRIDMEAHITEKHVEGEAPKVEARKTKLVGRKKRKYTKRIMKKTTRTPPLCTQEKIA